MISKVEHVSIKPALLKELKKLRKRDNNLLRAVNKKIREISTSDHINHYKNLSGPLKHLKRVHIGSFVLIFSYDPGDRTLDFKALEHHDKAYLKET